MRIAALLLLGGCAQLFGIDETSGRDGGTCTNGTKACGATSCTDGIKNGLETDVDCGGTACAACTVGASCSSTSDCATGPCTGSKCVYAKSCLELHDARPSLGDGVYTIDPDPTIAALPVYCDMTTDGGGWTLVHKNNLANTSDRTDTGYNATALLGPAVDDVAVLARGTIAAISPARAFRVLTTNGYKIYSLGGMPYYTTDNHTGIPYTGMLKYDWGAEFAPQVTLNPTAGNMHATMVCPAEGCIGTSSGHLATQRFCCETPNAGFWFDGSVRFRAGYCAGTGWVR